MAGGAQHKSSMSVGTLHHELNNWVTFDFEQSLHETNACPDRLVPCRCSGIPSRTLRDLRSEGGTVFAF